MNIIFFIVFWVVVLLGYFLRKRGHKTASIVLGLAALILLSCYAIFFIADTGFSIGSFISSLR